MVTPWKTPRAFAFLGLLVLASSAACVLAQTSQDTAMAQLATQWVELQSASKTNNKPWSSSSGADACNWFGVSCTNGVVTSITIDNIPLGDLPSTLSSLPKLEALRLTRCGLKGSMAPVMNLTTLSTLVLYGNEFSGSLPSPLLKRCPSTCVLDLSSNQFSGSLPYPLTGFTTFATLSLNISNNALSGNLGAITPQTNIKFTSLDASNNNFTGGIPDFFNIPSALYLQHNKLNGTVPPSLFNSSLLALDLANNRLDLCRGITTDFVFVGNGSCTVASQREGTCACRYVNCNFAGNCVSINDHAKMTNIVFGCVLGALVILGGTIMVLSVRKCTGSTAKDVEKL